MSQPRISIVSTGGTIAMSFDARLGGAMPALRGEDLLKSAAGLPDAAAVHVIDFCNKPGPHLGLADIMGLRDIIQRLFREDRTDGVVITQGTDTIEEVAYGLDLLLDDDRPIVITGAMRNASLTSSDGPANLQQAVLTAAAPTSRGRGVLVAFNNEIHSARDVTKASAAQLNAFRSPLLGPVGIISGKRVQFLRSLVAREHIPTTAVSARVELVKFTIGMDRFWLDALRNSGVDGVVVEGAGMGHLSEESAAGVADLVTAGKPVVLASRCYEGYVFHEEYAFAGSEKWLREAGAIPSGGLNGPKARLKLIFALSLTRDINRIRGMFGPS